MSEQKTIRAGVIGAAGYTGGELLRLLLRHPSVELCFAQSRSSAGKLLSEVHGDLFGETSLRFSAGWQPDAAVIFLCSGHGESRSWLETNALPDEVCVIDLSQDFRIRTRSGSGNRQFVYGLPELNHAAIRRSRSIANPGCFATAIQLGLLPLAAAGYLGEVSTTGITGSTGAGQSPSASSHFSWRSSNIQAYKTLEHQHVAEIEQSLMQAGSADARVHFVPWRGDFARGIYVSSSANTTLSREAALRLFADYYANAAFTFVSDRMIDLKQVVNTNKCFIHPEVRDGRIAVHTAIDNLLKGASGQAVQNMNIHFGLDERSGLELKASAF